MEEFLPSEIARLVLGYLEETSCKESWETFIKESSSLSEYFDLYQKGKVYTTKVKGMSLVEILEEYCDLKKQFMEKQGRMERLKNERSEELENCIPFSKDAVEEMIKNAVECAFRQYLPLFPKNSNYSVSENGSGIDEDNNVIFENEMETLNKNVEDLNHIYVDCINKTGITLNTTQKSRMTDENVNHASVDCSKETNIKLKENQEKRKENKNVNCINVDSNKETLITLNETQKKRTINGNIKDFNHMKVDKNVKNLNQVSTDGKNRTDITLNEKQKKKRENVNDKDFNCTSINSSKMTYTASNKILKKKTVNGSTEDFNVISIDKNKGTKTLKERRKKETANRYGDFNNTDLHNKGTDIAFNETQERRMVIKNIKDFHHVSIDSSKETNINLNKILKNKMINENVEGFNHINIDSNNATDVTLNETLEKKVVSKSVKNFNHISVAGNKETDITLNKTLNQGMVDWNVEGLDVNVENNSATLNETQKKKMVSRSVKNCNYVSVSGNKKPNVTLNKTLKQGMFDGNIKGTDHINIESNNETDILLDVENQRDSCSLYITEVFSDLSNRFFSEQVTPIKSKDNSSVFSKNNSSHLLDVIKIEVDDDVSVKKDSSTQNKDTDAFNRNFSKQITHLNSEDDSGVFSKNKSVHLLDAVKIEIDDDVLVKDVSSTQNKNTDVHNSTFQFQDSKSVDTSSVAEEQAKSKSNTSGKDSSDFVLPNIQGNTELCVEPLNILNLECLNNFKSNSNNSSDHSIKNIKNTQHVCDSNNPTVEQNSLLYTHNLVEKNNTINTLNSSNNQSAFITATKSVPIQCATVPFSNIPTYILQNYPSNGGFVQENTPYQLIINSPNAMPLVGVPQNNASNATFTIDYSTYDNEMPLIFEQIQAREISSTPTLVTNKNSNLIGIPSAGVLVNKASNTSDNLNNMTKMPLVSEQVSANKISSAPTLVTDLISSSKIPLIKATEKDPSISSKAKKVSANSKKISEYAISLLNKKGTKKKKSATIKKRQNLTTRKKRQISKSKKKELEDGKEKVCRKSLPEILQHKVSETTTLCDSVSSNGKIDKVPFVKLVKLPSEYVSRMTKKKLHKNNKSMEFQQIALEVVSKEKANKAPNKILAAKSKTSTFNINDFENTQDLVELDIGISTDKQSELAAAIAYCERELFSSTFTHSSHSPEKRATDMMAYNSFNMTATVLGSMEEARQNASSNYYSHQPEKRALDIEVLRNLPKSVTGDERILFILNKIKKHGIDYILRKLEGD